jgi:hypothetical protein
VVGPPPKKDKKPRKAAEVEPANEDQQQDSGTSSSSSSSKKQAREQADTKAAAAAAPKTARPSATDGITLDPEKAVFDPSEGSVQDVEDESGVFLLDEGDDVEVGACMWLLQHGMGTFVPERMLPVSVTRLHAVLVCEGAILQCCCDVQDCLTCLHAGSCQDLHTAVSKVWIGGAGSKTNLHAGRGVPCRSRTTSPLRFTKRASGKSSTPS